MSNVVFSSKLFGALVGDGAPLREHFASMSDGQLSYTIASEHIDIAPVIEQVERRTASLEQYLKQIREEDVAPSSLRKRITLLAIMGGLPFLIGSALALLLFLGVLVPDDNSRVLIGFLLVGCGLLSLLSLLAVVHVSLHAAFNNWLLAKTAKEKCSTLVTATAELYHLDARIGARTIDHFRSYPVLRDLLGDVQVQKGVVK